ncbi:MAG: hypothetical protein CMA19_02970, partial [Euryarchaeota archaeon]|nr:hypothetical protein [Euryarchaeota archaeon]
MPQSKSRNSSRKPGAKAIRSLTCGQAMSVPNVLSRDASVADALDRITSKNWDHLFIVNSEGV